MSSLPHGACRALWAGFLLAVSGCGSSVDITEKPECPVPQRTLSSVEGVSYLRCFVPGNEMAEVIGYSDISGHDDLHVGRFEGWSLVFRYEGVYYSAGIGMDGAGCHDWPSDPPDCAAGSIPVLDSVDLVPAAKDALSGIDPVQENFEPSMIHGMPCLTWGWHPQAGTQAVITFLPDGDFEPYRAVIFDDSGEVTRVCSKNACDGGQVEYCCE